MGLVEAALATTSYIRPTARNAAGSWTVSSGSSVNMWQLLDEETPDDMDYIMESTSANNGVRTVRLQFSGAFSGTITSAKLRIRLGTQAYYSGPAANYTGMNIDLTINGVSYGKVYLTSVNFVTHEITVNPSDLSGVNWATGIEIRFGGNGAGDTKKNVISWTELVLNPT